MKEDSIWRVREPSAMSDIILALINPNPLCLALLTLLLLITNRLPRLNSCLPLPRRPLPLPLQQLLQPLRRVKHTVRRQPARRTRRILPVPLQRATLAEVVPAPCHDRLAVRLLADETRKGYLFQHRLVLVIVLIFI